MVINFSFYKTAVRKYIQKKLSDFPRLNYLQRVWRNRKDDAFVSQVMNINHDPDVIRIQSFGQKNQEKNIYFIEIDGGKIGMGAYLRQILYALFEADQLGFVPAVSFRRETCLYAENEPVDGKDNPFEYYFDQVSDISIEDVYQSNRVFLFHHMHAYRIERDLGNLNPNMPCGYIVDDVYLEKLANIYGKYIHLNAKTAEMFRLDTEQLCANWKEKNILGVHIRGTDFALNWGNHPNMVTADEFIEAIDEALGEHDYDYIFLATDDQRRLDVLRERYGSKLIYYKDTWRGDSEKFIVTEKNNRVMHHYLSGLEVIRDMYTLARCDGLICGLSQVAVLARIICLAEEKPYKYLKVLDKGLYQG